MTVRRQSVFRESAQFPTCGADPRLPALRKAPQPIKPSLEEKAPAIPRDHVRLDHPGDAVDGQVVEHIGRWGLGWR
jgi:hypothetical protein